MNTILTHEFVATETVTRTRIYILSGFQNQNKTRNFKGVLNGILILLVWLRSVFLHSIERYSAVMSCNLETQLR